MKKKKKIRIYKGFKEAEIARLQAVLKQSPAKRLRDTVELILRAYGTTRGELKKRKYDRKIKIRGRGRR